MVAEDIFYRFDPRKIRVVAGDVPNGYWDLRSCKLKRSKDLFECNSKCSKQSSHSNEFDSTKEFDLDGRIQSLQVRTVEDANPLANVLGVSLGAYLGYKRFGVIGAVSGAVTGQLLVGNRKDYTVYVHLIDGKSFVAHMDEDVYRRMKIVARRCSEYSENN